MKKVCIGIHVQAEPQRVLDTLATLRAQSDNNAEIVLLLDGVSESSCAVYLPEVKFITGGMPGAPACFNLLAAHSDAEVIIFLEGGARVGPRCLEHLLRGLT